MKLRRGRSCACPVCDLVEECCTIRWISRPNYPLARIVTTLPTKAGSFSGYARCNRPRSRLTAPSGPTHMLTHAQGCSGQHAHPGPTVRDREDNRVSAPTATFAPSHHRQRRPARWTAGSRRPLPYQRFQPCPSAARGTAPVRHRGRSGSGADGAS